MKIDFKDSEIDQFANGAAKWFQFKIRNLLTEILAEAGVPEDATPEVIDSLLSTMEAKLIAAMRDCTPPVLSADDILRDARLLSEHPVDITVRPATGSVFALHNLRVVLEAGEGEIIGSGSAGSHRVGEYFDVVGENIITPPGGSLPMFSLAALVPILALRQRPSHPHDWVTTDTVIASPDPHCASRFRVLTDGHMVFRHDEVTAVPLDEDSK